MRVHWLPICQKAAANRLWNKFWCLDSTTSESTDWITSKIWSLIAEEWKETKTDRRFTTKEGNQINFKDLFARLQIQNHLVLCKKRSFENFAKICYRFGVNFISYLRCDLSVSSSYFSLIVTWSHFRWSYLVRILVQLRLLCFPGLISGQFCFRIFVIDEYDAFLYCISIKQSKYQLLPRYY